MPFIRTIGPWRARGELRRVYREIHRDLVGDRSLPLGVTVWNILRVFSVRPALLQAFQRGFVRTMWGGGLRRQAREAIGVAVARTNRCQY